MRGRSSINTKVDYADISGFLSVAVLLPGAQRTCGVEAHVQFRAQEAGCHSPGFRRMIIDIQTHYVPPAAATLMKQWGERGGRWNGLSSSRWSGLMFGLEERLPAMDAAGVGVSVLSFAPISGIEDHVFAAELSQAANEGLVSACLAHPDRFVMAAALPIPAADDAVAELKRMNGKQCVRAIQVVANTTRYRPDEASLQPVFEIAAERGLPVLLHPTAGAVDLAPEFDAYGLGSGMHAMVSHALVAARMIGAGLFDALPRLEVIATHLGGMLPFLIDRLDSRHRGETEHPPSHYLKNHFWLDACGFPTGPALRCAIETVGTERILLGSDWPSRSIAPAIAAIRELKLEAAAERAILGGNAKRWFDPAQ